MSPLPLLVTAPRPPPTLPPFPTRRSSDLIEATRADLMCTRAASESMAFLLDPAGLDEDIAEIWQDIRAGADVLPDLRDVLVKPRSEEHTSELQSLTNLVCRLLLETKKPAH